MKQHKIQNQNTIATKTRNYYQEIQISASQCNSPMCMVPPGTYPGGGLWWSDGAP